MLQHVAWQMEIIDGGLGDKMEDWVERLQQTGMRLRQQYRTAQNPIVCVCVNLFSGQERPFPILELTKARWTCLPPLEA